jgi:RimJ/RimL family protein N-acetyltransferase
MKILETKPRSVRGGQRADYRPARMLGARSRSGAMVRTPFTFGCWRAVEAAAADTAAIQAFFEANPEYTRLCDGRAPPPEEGREYVESLPPAEFTFRDHYWLLLRDERDAIDGLAAVAVDLLAPGVWHLGLFIAATRLHGSGFAQQAHAAYEQWARAQGARWLRLGVVTQNLRARRFWRRQGYVEVKRRDGVAMGELVNTVIVMVKPIAGALDEYLALMPREWG